MGYVVTPVFVGSGPQEQSPIELTQLCGGGQRSARGNDGTVHLAYIEGWNALVYVSWSMAAGAPSGATKVYLTSWDGTSNRASCSLCIDDHGKVCVTYLKSGSGKIEVYRNSGGTWGKMSQFTITSWVTPEHNYGHQIICTPAGEHRVFFYQTNYSAGGTWDNYCVWVYSTDNCTTWSSKMSLAGGPSSYYQGVECAIHGTVAVVQDPTNGKQHVLWCQRNPSGWFEIFHTKNNGGPEATYETPVLVGGYTGSPGVANLRAAMADDGTLHACFAHSTFKHIYYIYRESGTWYPLGGTVEYPWVSGAYFNTPNIGVTRDGRPYIAYFSYGSLGVDHYWRVTFARRYASGTSFEHWFVAQSSTAAYRVRCPEVFFLAYDVSVPANNVSVSAIEGGAMLGLFNEENGYFEFHRLEEAYFSLEPLANSTLQLTGEAEKVGGTLRPEAYSILGLGGSAQAEQNVWYRSAENTLNLSGLAQKVVPVTAENEFGLIGQYPSTDKDVLASAENTLSLTGTASQSRVIRRSASNSLGFSHLGLWGQWATGSFKLTGVAEAGGVRQKDGEGTLRLTGVAAAFIVEGFCTDRYDPGYDLADSQAVLYTQIIGPVLNPKYSMILPKPDFGDRRKVGLNDEVGKDENGGYYLYKHTPVVVALEVGWSQLSRKRVYELADLLKNVAAQEVFWRDHHNIVWKVRILTRAHEIVEQLTDFGGRVLLEFEGTVIQGA